MSDMPIGWRVVYGISAAILPLVYFPSMYLFWKHRSHLIVHNRSVWSVTASITAIAVFGFVGSIGNASLKLSCIGVIIPTYLTIFHMNFLAERCFLLIAHFKAALQAKDYAEAKATHQDAEENYKLGWYLKHRHLFHHGWLSASKAIAGIVSLVHLIVIIAVMASDSASSTGPSGTDGCQKLYNDILPVTNAVLFLALISIVLCIWNLRKVRENFGIRTELKRLGIVIGIGLLFYAIEYGTQNDGFSRFAGFYFSTVVPILEVLVSVSSVVWQVRQHELLITKKKNKDKNRTKKVSRQASSGGGSSVVDKLREILSNEKHCKLFVDFLIQEFAAENVFFLKAVEEYQAAFADPTKSEEERKRNAASIAKEIYKKYVAPSSKLCINVPSSCRIALTDAYNLAKESSSFSENMFDQAQTEIFHLLAEDSMRRFLRSCKGVHDELRASAMSLESPTNASNGSGGEEGTAV